MGLKEEFIRGEDDMVEKAISICRGYLSGIWKKIGPEDVSVKKLSGGLSNLLYIVRLEKGVATPKEVLLRIYGQTHGDDALESLITESVVFTLLSERKLGPKLFGVFPGGRIEEYIPARALIQQEMSDPAISLLVAEKMAAVHTMNVPINKEPNWLWDTINKWLNNLDEIYSGKLIIGKFNPMDLKNEADWLRRHLSKIYSPVVFCHNDLQQGNILLHHDSEDQKIVLIDFEYCSYNYRGFDLANHFVEWTYDYNLPEDPKYSVNKDCYPSHAQMHSFVERYLSAIRENGGKYKGDHDKIHSVLREIKHYTLASHFFWGLWSAINANFSKIPFGYKEYAEERFNCYYELKNKILSKSQNFMDKNISVKRKILEPEE